MDEARQITFMQARISQMASRRWDLSLRQVMDIFASCGVLEYVEDCYDYFHLQGDEAILDDIARYLKLRGVVVYASAT